MGPIRLQIEIANNPSLVYQPGQMVEGQVRLVLQNPCSHQGIKLKFVGQASVHWTETRTVSETTGSSADQQTTTRTVTDNYSASENYFYFKTYLLTTGPNSSNGVIPPGDHIYPFQFQLPLGIPSTFQGGDGRVYYHVEAVLKRPIFKSNVKHLVPFRVTGVLDLNSIQGANSPVFGSKEKRLCCLCCQSGPIGLRAQISKSGYVPGEEVYLDAEFSNQSTSRVKGVTATLLQTVAYKATTKTNYSRNVLCQHRTAAVLPGDSGVWRGPLFQIPSTALPTNLGGCRIIGVSYMILFKAEIDGGFSLKLTLPLVIGTVEGRGIEPPAIINQPTSASVPFAAGGAGNDDPPSYFECTKPTAPFEKGA